MLLYILFSFIVLKRTSSSPSNVAHIILSAYHGLQTLTPQRAPTSCYRRQSDPKLQNEICRSVKHQLKDECRFKGLCETI